MNANEKSRDILKRNQEICEYLDAGHTYKEAAAKYGLTIVSIGQIKWRTQTRLDAMNESIWFHMAADELGLSYGMVTKLRRAMINNGILPENVDDWIDMNPDAVLKHRGCGPSCAELLRTAQRLKLEEDLEC